MNISLPTFLSKKSSTEYFLALVLRDEKVTAVIFKEFEGKIQVVGEHEEYFSESLEKAPWEEFLEVLDKAISTAEEPLPENVETQKTIFGVQQSWVEDTKIKKEHLLKLKKASDSLGLSPIGFLVITEAIAHSLEKDEGAPVSGILLDVGKETLSMSLLRGGKVIENHQTELEASLAVTTDKLLHHFSNYEVLPSKIIIFNVKNHEKITQEFISHPWSKDLAFLHVPQVKILPKQYDAKAMLLGAATQMGFEVLGDHTTSHAHHEETVSHQSKKKNEEQLDEEKDQEKPEKEYSESTHDFGFVKEQDITEVSHTKKKEVTLSEAIQEPTLQDDTLEFETPDYTPQKPHISHTKKSLFTSVAAVIPMIKKILPKSFSLSSLLLPLRGVTVSGRNTRMLLLPIGILGFIILALLLYLFTLRAQVDILVDPKTVETQKEITFSSDEATDFSKNIIHADLVTITEDGSTSTPATGVKETGDKAKGTVTILSSLSRQQSIPAGTAVTSSSGLVFLTDKDINIASSSGVSDIKSAQTSVTAKDIGKEYNLPSSTTFSVGTFDKSSVQAKNDSAFSGGSKKEITVVDRKDLDKLASDLENSLESKAKDEITQKISSDQTILPTFVETALTKKSFDKEVGSEAKTVTLKGTVTYNSLAYSKNDIQEFSKKTLEDNTNNSSLSNENISYTVEDIKVTQGKEITGTIHLNARLLPIIQPQKLSEDISGKSFTDAFSIITKIPQVKDVEIRLVPNLPFLPNLLPRAATNITITIKQ